MMSLQSRLLLAASFVLLAFLVLCGAGLESAFRRAALNAQEDRMRGLVYALLGLGLWVWLKVAIWLAVGGVVTLVRRRPSWAGALWVLLPLLGGAAAWLAIYKPVG